MSKQFRLKDRLKLFDQVVTPCLLYGAGCWSLSEERRHKLRVNQRRMIRKIVDVKRLWSEMGSSGGCSNQVLSSHSSSSSSTSVETRAEQENWIDFIKRATHIAEDWSSKAGVRDWASEHYRSKFRLAGHMARREDGRWSARVLEFRPKGGGRSRGHPCKRWAQELDDFFSATHALDRGEWTAMVHKREVWKSLEDSFVAYWVR